MPPAPPAVRPPVEAELGPALDVDMLYGMHDAAAQAAAAAGALVHALRESVPRAANIAEAALDPRGGCTAVCHCARRVVCRTLRRMGFFTLSE